MNENRHSRSEKRKKQNNNPVDGVLPQCYRVFTEFFWLVNRLSSMAYRVLLGFMNTDRVDFD